MASPLQTLNTLAAPVRRTMVAQVRSLFHDRTRGEGPVERRPDGLFGPASVAWRVNADATSMMVGGVSGLLLQMLHPAVLAGVWDHSNFRTDMHGRLRRTARFIAVTTYAGREDALAAIAHVRKIHDHVGGTLPDGTPYQASDPALLAWVHVTEAWSFLAGWRRYGGRALSAAEEDQYFAEMAVVAEGLGADPVPRSKDEARRLIQAMRPALRCDARTREVAHLVLSQKAPSPAAAPFLDLTLKAGVDLLPDWARRMHGLPNPPLSTAAARAATRTLAASLRWAFAETRPEPSATEP
jgi:uncharacterized protein (DUF2236 family)